MRNGSAATGRTRKAFLKRTFEEVDGYDEIVVLRDISFESHCEHHMAPIIGRVHIGYLPRRRVVGISKLARLVEVYAKRLQIQERFTAQIANTLNEVLKPHGVAVVVQATHGCMTTRGVHKTAAKSRDQPHAWRFPPSGADTAGIPGSARLARGGARDADGLTRLDWQEGARGWPERAHIFGCRSDRTAQARPAALVTR